MQPMLDIPRFLDRRHPAPTQNGGEALLMAYRPAAPSAVTALPGKEVCDAGGSWAGDGLKAPQQDNDCGLKAEHRAAGKEGGASPSEGNETQSFLDRRSPTRAAAPEGGGVPDSANSEDLSQASGPAAPAAGPSFPRKDDDTMAKKVTADDFRDDQTGESGEPAAGKNGSKAKPGRVGGVDPDKVKAFANRLESLHDELEETSGVLRKDIKDVYDEAREAGIQPKLLRMVFKSQRDAAKLAAKVEKLDGDEKAELEAIKLALGDFGDTPLGEAAQASASQASAARPKAAEIGAPAGTA